MMKALHLSTSWTDAGEILAKVFLVIVTYFSSAVTFVDGQGPAYLYGTSVTFPCAVTEMGAVAYTWTDAGVNPNKIIYFIVSSDESSKHSDVDGIAKYDNFGINNSHPSSVDLTIDSLDFNDDGIYRCSLSRGESPPDELVIVEALPTSVSVSCTTSPPGECPESAGDSSVFTCTCTAVGAYPGDLHFEWTNAEPTSTSIDPSTNRNGAYDFTGIATFRPNDTENTVTCSLGGYNGSWSVPDSNYTVVPPGKCDISISCNDEATVATLACSCPNGVPEDTIYTYYDENGAVVTSEISVTPGVQFTVGCRGCNGVNYGEDRFISKNHICTVTTVTTPTTSTGKKVNPTGTKGPPVGLIVGLSVGIPILIIILVLAIWFFKNRGGINKVCAN